MSVHFQYCKWNEDADSNSNLIFKLSWMKGHRGRPRRTRILGVGGMVVVTKKTSWHKAEASSVRPAKPKQYEFKREGAVGKIQMWGRSQRGHLRPPNQHHMESSKIRILECFYSRDIRVTRPHCHRGQKANSERLNAISWMRMQII